MLNQILVKIYSTVPLSVKRYLGQSKFLKPIRDALLRNKRNYLEALGKIRRDYGNYPVDFWFYSDPQNVSKAKKNGIESTLLNNSIVLINKYKGYKNDCVVLDIGANFGFLSLVWAHSLCKNNGRIFAFEPSPNLYGTFLKSTTKNKLTSVITVENCAVGSEDKTIELYLSNTTSNTLKLNASAQAISIEMISVDTYLKKNNIERCDLVKIDVDGIELDILNGCIRTIEKLKPIFIVETNEDIKIVEFFMKRNYKILDMRLKEYQRGTVLPLNIFCIPQD